MATDKIRKYVLPNIPYLFIGWFCLKIGTAYRLAAGTGFGEKLLGLGQTIGAAFASGKKDVAALFREAKGCLLYTSPSPRDRG